MSDRTYYVIREDNCKFESMTKEQIIAAIAEATGATPTQIDDAFITKIKEQNANTALKFWVGTNAQYNALTPANDIFYIITDTDPLTDLTARVTTAESDIDDLASDVDTLETSVSAQGTRLTTAEGSITSQGTRLTQAESDIDTLEAKFRIPAPAADWRVVIVNGEVDMYYNGTLGDVELTADGNIARSVQKTINYPTGYISSLDFATVSFGGFYWAGGISPVLTSATKAVKFYVFGSTATTIETLNVYVHIHGKV